MKSYYLISVIVSFAFLCISCEPEPDSTSPSLSNEWEGPSEPISSNVDEVAYGAPRLALVMGNESYRDNALNNPINDANDVAEALGELGFEVMLLTNLNYEEMYAAVEQFSERLPNGGTAVFYYAGHGVQVNNENYLIPVDAELEQERDVRREAIALNDVIALLNNTETNFNILMIDACRDNPFYRRWRTTTRGWSGQLGLAEQERPRGTAISFSTSPGNFSDDGSGRNSPYTESLLRNIRNEGEDIAVMFRKVRNDVLKATQENQEPWYRESLSGAFFFNPAEENVTTASKNSAASPNPIISEGPDELSEITRAPQTATPPESESSDESRDSSSPVAAVPNSNQSVVAASPQALDVRSQRVSFPSGSEFMNVANNVSLDQVKRYIVNAQEGTILTVRVKNSDKPVSFSLFLPSGDLLADAANLQTWQGFLPQGGDYSIDVVADQLTEFTLEIGATTTVPSQ